MSAERQEEQLRLLCVFPPPCVRVAAPVARRVTDGEGNEDGTHNLLCRG